MISKILLLLLFVCTIYSCDYMPSGVDNSNIESSVAGKLVLINSLAMHRGPEDLLVMDTFLFAKKDNKIYKISIANLEKPILIDSFIDNKTPASFFGRMIAREKQILVPNHNGNLYILDTNLSGQNLEDSANIAYSLDIPNFKAHSILIDKAGEIFIGGTNGSNGILAQYLLDDNKLQLKNSWTIVNTDTNLESLVEKDGYIIASTTNGNLLVFSKKNISIGPLTNPFMDKLNGLTKWGYSLMVLDDLVYWANWEAGLAAYNFQNPLNPIQEANITNKDFKAKFPLSEGTSVYDIVYNAKKNYICVANGWQGIFIIDADNPKEVIDYIDPKFFQNRCIATKDEYLYVGNISPGVNGDLKGIKVFKLN